MNTAINYTDIKTIAEALGVSKQGCQKRANKEAWPFDEVPFAGGNKRLYPLSGLPKIVVRKVQSRAAVLAMKEHVAAKKQQMPNSFMVVLGNEVYEVRKVQS